MSNLPAVIESDDFDVLATWLRAAAADWRRLMDNRAQVLGEFFYRAALALTPPEYRRLERIGAEEFSIGADTIGRYRHRYQTDNALPPPSPQSARQAKAAIARAASAERALAQPSQPGGAVQRPAHAEQEPPPGSPAPAPPAPSAAEAAPEVDEPLPSPAARSVASSGPDGSGSSADPGAGDSSTTSAEPSDSAAPSEPPSHVVRGSNRSAGSPDASAHVDRGESGSASDRGHETKRRVGTTSRAEPVSAAPARPSPSEADALVVAVLALGAEGVRECREENQVALLKLADRLQRLRAESNGMRVVGDLTRTEVTPRQKRSVKA